MTDSKDPPGENRVGARILFKGNLVGEAPEGKRNSRIMRGMLLCGPWGTIDSQQEEYLGWRLRNFRPRILFAHSREKAASHVKPLYEQ